MVFIDLINREGGRPIIKFVHNRVGALSTSSSASLRIQFPFLSLPPPSPLTMARVISSVAAVLFLVATVHAATLVVPFGNDVSDNSLILAVERGKSLALMKLYLYTPDERTTLPETRAHEGWG
jgi:hypothetical protein